MTVYRRRLLCFALALSLLISLIPAGTGLRSAAYAASKRLGITTDKVNIRYGPSTGEKIMFTAPAGHVFTIKETTGKDLYDVKRDRGNNIDTSQDFNEITNAAL